LKAQAGRLIHTSNLFYHSYQSKLAKRLTTLANLDRAFFCNSGTEAWEGALKLARAYAKANKKTSPKWRILAMENSFHGRTFGSLATTGQPKYRKPFEPLMDGIRFVRLNDEGDLRRNFDSSVCAICLETIQGESGIRPATRSFLQLARKLTRQSGALLLPAGLPLGAILTTNRVASAIHPGMHGTTFGGGPLACAVALEFLNVLDGLHHHINQVGKYFREKLESLQDKHPSVREVRGYGLMLGMELDSTDTAKAVVNALLGRGIIINRAHENVLRFLPPYIIEARHVDAVVTALDQELAAIPSSKTKPGKATPTQRRRS
jgi:acetylornithine aminotransferase/acetylornithine/N-succinyldiaminopimelate aminotransferase